MNGVRWVLSNVFGMSGDGKRRADAQPTRKPQESPHALSPMKLVAQDVAGTKDALLRDALTQALPKELIVIVSEYGKPHDPDSLRQVIAQAPGPVRDGKRALQERSWAIGREALLEKLEAWIDDPSMPNTMKLLDLVNNDRAVAQFHEDVLDVVARAWQPAWRGAAGSRTLVRLARVNPDVIDVPTLRRWHVSIADEACRAGNAEVLDRVFEAVKPGLRHSVLSWSVARGIASAGADADTQPERFRVCASVLCKRMRADKQLYDDVRKISSAFTPANLSIYAATIRKSELSKDKQEALVRCAELARSRADARRAVNARVDWRTYIES